MDSKPPLQAKPMRRKVHVVYYLSRGGGLMDHPHLLEGYLSATQDGLRLRDFKRWLAVLRGKSMPTSYAWSYKRTYKNGFIWHDLGENDLIQPLSKNEYVLMGSEIKEQGGNVGKCKCGGLQQHAESKVDVAEVGDIRQDQEPSNKPVLRSPKLVASSPARLGMMITSENKFHDNGSPMMLNKSSLYRGGGSSRSFNDLTVQRLLEDAKKPTSHHDTKHQLATIKSFNNLSRSGANVRVLSRDCEIVADHEKNIEENGTDHMVQGELLHEAGRRGKDNIKYNKGSPNCAYVQQGMSTHKTRGYHDYKDGIINEDHYIKDEFYEDRCRDGISVSHADNEDDINGTYIVDAGTQTGDSTRCSTEDHQEGPNSAGYNNMVDSPGESSKLNTIRRVSSARFNHSHGRNGTHIKGNLSMHFSQDFSSLTDVEKSIMINQSLVEVGEIQDVGNVSSLSNHTSLHNHIGSPGALSSSSTMSARSSTRFAREETNRASSNNSTKKYGVKSEDHYHHRRHHHHHHNKGTTSHCNASTMANPSAPHTLFKQLLTCGNTDVVSEKKPNNTTDNVMMISNNALSGLPTPPRAKSTGSYQDTSGVANKSKSVLCAACKPSGLVKRTSSCAASSADNRSVISATASEQGSIRDTLEMISSPESVYTASHRRHVKSNMMRAHSLSTASAASALRSHSHFSSQNSSPALTQQPPSAPDADYHNQHHHHHHHHPPAEANGNNSPGTLSVGSSTSRRSSIIDNEVNKVGGGDVVEGFHEALQCHHIGVRLSSKSRANKGNKNTLLINDIPDKKEAPHDNKQIDTDTDNAKGGSKTRSTTVSELHKLICDSSGTPTCGNHNKVTSTNFLVPLEQTSSHNYHHTLIHNTRDSYTSHRHKPHHIPIATHGPPRTPRRSSNLSSPGIDILSKSLHSPSSSLFLERSQPPPTSSSYISSWKDLLWSPRNNASQKEKEKRQMKP